MNLHICEDTYVCKFCACELHFEPYSCCERYFGYYLSLYKSNNGNYSAWEGSRVCVSLTHISLASLSTHIGKQCKTKSDAAERASDQGLHSLLTGISIKKSNKNEKSKTDTPKIGNGLVQLINSFVNKCLEWMFVCK